MFQRTVTVNEKFFHSYQPIFQISRLVGLSPLTYKKITKSMYSFQWSWPLCICNHVAITALTILGFWGLYTFLKENAQGFIWSSVSKSNYFAILDFGELEMFGFYFVISQPFGFGKMSTLLHGFDQIDSLVAPSESEDDRRWTIIFGCVVLLVFSLVVVFDGVVIWSNVSGSELGLKDYPFYIIYFVVIVFEIQYWQLVYLIERRMRLVNRELEKNVNDLQVQNHATILNAIRAYECIYDAINTLNNLFNVHVSLIILSCFLRLVLDLYMLYVTLTGGEDLVLILVQLAWIFIHFCRLLIILEVCQMCENQNQKTFNLVLSLITCFTHEKIKKELSNFALELTQKKIKFSSFAIPRINRSLLTTVISSITTFLIIFIQFSAS